MIDPPEPAPDVGAVAVVDAVDDEPTRPRSRRALVAFGAVAAVVIVAFVSTSTGFLRLGPPADMPPAGAVWFGAKYDPATLVLDRTWTTSPTGQPVAVVAHLSRPSTPGLVVTMTLDGSQIVHTTIEIGSGHDYVAFAPGVALGHVAGTWVVSIADAQGIVATGTLTVTP